MITSRLDKDKCDAHEKQDTNGSLSCCDERRYAGSCPDWSIKAISKVLTNVYLAVSDDCEVNCGQISDTLKELIIAMALEYMKMKDDLSSFTDRDLPGALAPLDRAAERIIMGRTVDLSDEDREQILYWFLRVRNEYTKRKGFGPNGYHRPDDINIL